MALSPLLILAVYRTRVKRISLTVESSWLSGKASERGIRRSEVRSLMGTQNFLFVPRTWQDEKHFSLFLYRAQNLYHLSHSVYKLHESLVQKPLIRSFMFKLAREICLFTENTIRIYCTNINNESKSAGRVLFSIQELRSSVYGKRKRQTLTFLTSYFNFLYTLIKIFA